MKQKEMRNEEHTGHQRGQRLEYQRKREEETVVERLKNTLAGMVGHYLVQVVLKYQKNAVLKSTAGSAEM